MRNCFALFILLITFASKGQVAYDRFGPYGVTVHADLKIALKTPEQVYKLDLSYQAIEPKLFQKFDKFTNLQTLHFSSNSLTTWPENISSLNNLVYLATFNNEFTVLPKDFKKFTNLMYLELFGTKIDFIPREINYLQRLKIFKFSSSNDTLKLPNTMRFMKNLQELTIESVILDSLPWTVFRIPSLKFLSLTSNAIQALPDNLDKMVGLEVLVLDQNSIRVLPRNIYKLKKLIYLSLKNNKLTKIPDTICHLTNLTKLDLRGNMLNQTDIEEVKALLPGCKVLF